MEKLKAHLSFELDGELYAINAGKVMSILEMVRLTRIPNSPPYLAGVINLRGKVLPVINTRVKLGLPDCERNSQTAIIVINVVVSKETVTLGIMVDNVHSVLEIEDTHLMPPPSIGKSYKAEYITAIIEGSVQENEKEILDKKLIMLLDIDKIFEDINMEIITNQELASK